MQASLFPPKGGVSRDDIEFALSVETLSGGRRVIILPPVKDGKRNVQDIEGVNSAQIHAVVNKTVWAQYTLKSAFHKEVRRSDHDRGYAFARWVSRHLGDKSLQRYCRTALFEETRNIELMRWFDTSGATGLDMASKLLSSAKKHALKKRDGCYEAYVAAYRRALDIVDRPGDQEIVDILNSGNLADAYLLHWMMWQDANNDDTRFKDRADLIFKKWACDHSEHARWLAKASWMLYPFYPTKILAEMSAGKYDKDESCHLEVVSRSSPIWLPIVKPYAFDNHTMEGMSIYSRHVVNLKPGLPAPHPQLDARYSGLLRGVYWRDAACRAGLDISTARWEDAPMNAQVWADTLMVDGWFYKKLYDRANLNPDGSAR